MKFSAVSAIALTIGLMAGPALADDRDDVAKVLADASAGWSRGELDTFMASYEKAPQINYVSGGKIIQGYDAIRAMYAPRFADPKAMPRLSTEVVDFDPLGADYAAVIGRFNLDLPNGEKATGLFSLVFHKTSDGWRIVSDHSG